MRVCATSRCHSHNTANSHGLFLRIKEISNSQRLKWMRVCATCRSRSRYSVTLHGLFWWFEEISNPCPCLTAISFALLLTLLQYTILSSTWQINRGFFLLLRKFQENFINVSFSYSCTKQIRGLISSRIWFLTLWRQTDFVLSWNSLGRTLWIKNCK